MAVFGERRHFEAGLSSQRNAGWRIDHTSGDGSGLTADDGQGRPLIDHSTKPSNQSDFGKRLARGSVASSEG